MPTTNNNNAPIKYQYQEFAPALDPVWELGLSRVELGKGVGRIDGVGWGDEDRVLGEGVIGIGEGVIVLGGGVGPVVQI